LCWKTFADGTNAVRLRQSKPCIVDLAQKTLAAAVAVVQVYSGRTTLAAFMLTTVK